MRNIHPSCSFCICNRALQMGLKHMRCIEFISPQGLGIENMDKSHISLQLMGDSVQVFIYAVDAWLNQGKRNNQS